MRFAPGASSPNLAFKYMIPFGGKPFAWENEFPTGACISAYDLPTYGNPLKHKYIY